MKKGCFIFIFIILLIGGYFFITVSRYNSAISYKDSTQSGTALITVQKGETPASVRQKLIDNNVIKDDDIFFGYTAYRIYAFTTKFDTKIQAGTYLMNKGSSIMEVANELQKADLDNNKLTIREGLRIEEIADEINRVMNQNNKKSKFNKIDFVNIAHNYVNTDYEFLSFRPQGNKSLEGYLFPDTYFINSEATAEDFIKIMLQNFDYKIYEPYKTQIKNNKYSLHELTTLASIIQREVRTKEDMAMVSDILFKRLNEGIKLEVDSTTQYGLGYSQFEGVWWKKDLTAQDLNNNSPYNTRKFAGLPPGPIDSFGVDAFSAVIQPTSNPYYYYLSDSEGITHYAKTYAEHAENIKKYL